MSASPRGVRGSVWYRSAFFLILFAVFVLARLALERSKVTLPEACARPVRCPLFGIRWSLAETGEILPSELLRLQPGQ